MVTRDGSLAKLTSLRTNTGLKDNYQDYFFSVISKATKNIPSLSLRRQQIIHLASVLPENCISPVWSIKGTGSFFLSYFNMY